MLLSKDLLTQVEHYTITCELEKYTGNPYDIITLHFRQWWKRKQVIRNRRIIVRWLINKVTFVHDSSDETIELVEQLKQYIKSTLNDDNDIPVKRNSNVVLQLVKHKYRLKTNRGKYNG